jgi:hypothetical protein
MYHLDDYRKYIYVPKFNMIDNIIEDLFTEYKEVKKAPKSEAKKASKSTSVLKPEAEKLPKSEPKVKKSLASEVVTKTESKILTPELEEEHGIIEYLKLEPEDEEDEMMKEMADANNNARAKQIEQLSKKLGINFIDPNINIKA